jgi:hypothetical protein
MAVAGKAQLHAPDLIPPILKMGYANLSTGMNATTPETTRHLISGLYTAEKALPRNKVFLPVFLKKDADS